MSKIKPNDQEEPIMHYVVQDDEGAWLTETPSETDTILFQSESLFECEQALCRACQ